MGKIINLVIFQDVKGLAFMKCPVCKVDILITIDKWCKCRNAYDKKHQKKKKVYMLKKDMRVKKGFTKILEVEVKNYRRATLKELEV